MHPDYIAFDNLTEAGALAKVIELNNNGKLDEIEVSARYAKNDNPESAVVIARNAKLYDAMRSFYRIQEVQEV